MLDSGESQKEVIRPDFNQAIMIDFQGAKISSDVGFLLVQDRCRQTILLQKRMFLGVKLGERAPKNLF